MERAKKSFRPRRIVSLTRRMANPKGVQRRLIVAVGVLFVAVASLLAYATASRTVRGSYPLADDCPRGALVYAQVADLPALLRLWNNSKLKEHYLASTNFKQFQNGHVALKLVERGREFSDALGFTLDADALAEATEQRAAVAVYDIGRMELVFVAPVTKEKVLAAHFFQDTGQFEETKLADGTIYYSRDVEADGGRQHQKISFAFVKSRFVLTTDEQLMLRTLANINGKSRRDKLSDDPAFKTLSGEVAPHFASVWVDQAKLEGDYYFKHYWAMTDAARLRGLRAGIFDFEMRERSWLERREFVLQDDRQRQQQGVALSAQELRRLRSSIPSDAAYARLRVLSDGAHDASSLVSDTLLDRVPADKAKEGRSARLHEDFNPRSDTGTDAHFDDDRYSYLDSDYDEAIDDAADAVEGEGKSGAFDAERRAETDLEHVLEQARPSRAASAVSLLAHDSPLFVYFRRLAILTLNNPGGLDRQKFERAVESLVASRLTVAATAGAGLSWTDGEKGTRRWRELELPMLGWKICYALKGEQMLVANDPAFLAAALDASSEAQPRPPDTQFTADDVAIIRLDQKETAFKQVFAQLDAQRVKDYWESRGATAAQEQGSTSEEFFSGNVASLLDVTSSVSRVEIRRRSSPARLHVEVEMFISDAVPDGNSRQSPALDESASNKD